MFDSKLQMTPRLQAAGIWVATALSLFVLLLMLGSMQRHHVPELSYGADETYLNLALGRALQTTGRLQLDETAPVPAAAESLWQLALSVGLRFAARPEGVPIVLGTIAALLVAGLTRSLARLWHAAPWTAGASLLVAVGSGLALEVIQGSSLPLSTLLVVLMLARYLESAPQDRWPLPISVAVWGGLAALIHVELVLVWLALALHAVATGPLRNGRGYGSLFPLIRMVSGLILIGIVMAPAIAWNLGALGVPWPRFPDAPMSLDVWASHPSAEAFSISAGLAMGAVAESYARAFSVPILRGGLPLIFLALGLVRTVQDARGDRHRLMGTASLFLLLIPLGYALIYPYTGWGAADAVFGALQPAWAVMVVLGVSHGAQLLCRFVKNMAKQEVEWLSPRWAASVLLTLLSLMGVISQLDAGRRDVIDLIAVRGARLRVAGELGEPGPGHRVASDRVGWLAWQRPGPYIDLTGRLSPVVLTFQTESGWQMSELGAHLRDAGVRRLVTWDARFSFAERALGIASEAEWPRVSRIR